MVVNSNKLRDRARFDSVRVAFFGAAARLRSVRLGLRRATSTAHSSRGTVDDRIGSGNLAEAPGAPVFSLLIADSRRIRALEGGSSCVSCVSCVL